MAAEGTVLHLHFKDAGDDDMTIKFPHANDSATDAQVKNLADTIITNRLAWNSAPTTKVGAQLITTAIVDVDIDD